MRTKNICYITDANYIIPTMTSVASVLQNVEDVHVWIIAAGALENFKNTENISIISIDEEYMDIVRGLEGENKNHLVSMLKFLLPELLKDIDSVLYLDGDTIVQEELEELFELDISDYYLAAVPDIGAAAELSYRVGIDSDKYFNSGVMLLNLRCMRDENISEKLLQYKKTGINFYQDQDAFNVVCKSKVKYLNKNYNFLCSVIRKYRLDKINELLKTEYTCMDDVIDHQSIVHFTDPKPWKYDVPFVTRRFIKYYEKSINGKQELKLEYPVQFTSRYIDEQEKIKSNLKKKVESLEQEISKYEIHKRWRFIYEDIKKGDKVAIYGSGKVGKSIHEEICSTGIADVVAWVDKTPNCDRGIYPCEYLQQVKMDWIIIATVNEQYKKEMLENLSQLKIGAKQILF